MQNAEREKKELLIISPAIFKSFFLQSSVSLGRRDLHTHCSLEAEK